MSRKPGAANVTRAAARVLPAKLSAGELRRELSARNLALAGVLPHETTIGDIPSVVYQEQDGLHGNFVAPSYRRICASPDWNRRLKKSYTANHQVPRSADRTRRELDCANSSDALLMNIFCYPGVTSRRSVCSLLGIGAKSRPEFGFHPRVPFHTGRCDRTEIDLRIDHLLVEAKLTESGFQSARPDLLLRYEALATVFDLDDLPFSGGFYHFYQLIRGVLAAHHCGMSFVVLCDARRSDHEEAWFRIMRAVRSCVLRARLGFLTWQELSCALPGTLQRFLADKYGIEPAS